MPEEVQKAPEEKPKYKRRCANWLDTFGEWVLPLSAEAPEQYIFWSGLFALACVLQRRVKIPKKYLGRWECPPHMYVMFIGPPGMRKTTTARAASELLDEVGGIAQASDVSSVAALTTELVAADNASLYFIIEEFSDIMGKVHGKEMYEFLTSMYDGKKKFKVNTISRSYEFAENPCINMLAATTPKWVGSNMPEDVIGGGFASRVVFVYADELRNRKLFYDDVYDDAEYERLKKMLVDDLKHLATLNGEVKFEKEARDYLEEWYKQLKPPSNPKLAGYFQRKPAHVMKLAMLWHVAKSDTLVITKNDIENAIKIIESVEHDMPKVFEAIGKNPHVMTNREIYQFLFENGPTPRELLLRQFEAADTPIKVDELINGLIDRKLIRGVTKDGKLCYEAIRFENNGTSSKGDSS